MLSLDKLSPGRRRIVLLVIVVVGLFVLRTVVGLTAAWIHFSSTQDFETYVAEHAVAPEEVENLLGSGPTLDGGGPWSPWSIGSIDPDQLPPDSNLETRTLRLTVDIDHGDAVLLDLQLDIAVAMDADTYDREGIVVDAPVLRTHPGMRAVVSVGLGEIDQLLGPGSMGKGFAAVDVVLVSGGGEPELRFYELDSLPEPAGRSSAPSLPIWRMLSGIVHPLGSPPERGLIHHVNTRLTLDWHKSGSGSGGPSIRPPYATVNSEQYSYNRKIETASFLNGRHNFSTSVEESRTWTWNGTIW